MKIILIALFTTLLAAAATVNYSYDAAGRLAKIDYGTGGSITYTYDNAGNLLSRTVIPAGQNASQKVPETEAQSKPAEAAPPPRSAKNK